MEKIVNTKCDDRMSKVSYDIFPVPMEYGDVTTKELAHGTYRGFEFAVINDVIERRQALGNGESAKEAK